MPDFALCVCVCVCGSGSGSGSGWEVVQKYPVQMSQQP